MISFGPERGRRLVLEHKYDDREVMWELIVVHCCIVKFRRKIKERAKHAYTREIRRTRDAREMISNLGRAREFHSLFGQTPKWETTAVNAKADSP